MIDRNRFQEIESRFGNFASWAVWAEVDKRPKSKMEDISIFKDPSLPYTLEQLHNDFVLLGLNISTIDIVEPLSNFHGQNGEVYKLRYALQGTPLWGSYMTDIIKDFKEADSIKILKYFKQNPQNLKDHIEKFEDELSVLGGKRPTLVALGHGVYEILKESFDHSHSIIRIPHYAARVSKEIYRDQVAKMLREAHVM